MRKSVRIWLFLILAPWVLLFVSSIPITISKTLTDSSFIVQPGERKEFGSPNYEECVRCVLTGEVSVEGAGITFIYGGMDAEPSGATVYVDHQYNFALVLGEHAVFIFDNKNGSSAVSVKFLVREDATFYLSRFGYIVSRWGLLTTPIGIIALIIIDNVSKKRKRTQLEIEPSRIPKDLYEELLRVYTQSIGGKISLDRKINSLMNQGLSREEVIRKIAEEDKLI